MGNAAAVQGVAESSRRRLLLQQYNRKPDALLSHSLLRAFQQRQLQSQPQSSGTSDAPHSTPFLALDEIHDVLLHDFGVQCTLAELPVVLRHLGCRLIEAPTSTKDASPSGEVYSIQELVAYTAPRRVLRQVKRPLVCPNGSKFSLESVTIWQAAKMGNLHVLEAICIHFSDAYFALDDFDNSPLYYASLCGREAIVDFVMRAYGHEHREVPSDELLRCVTNALNPHIRALLQKKLTLEEVLEAKKQTIESSEDEGGGAEGDGAWFGLLAGDDDEYEE
ncbi:hypothetical protein BBJ28_00010251 [Nothophytophthora sp. Chile5]|nr:hypothetical protein BBJ28_00010251 [Nothophytophthora sp. Chile5]